MAVRILIVLIVAMFAAFPARAATSVFGASVFSTAGSVTDAGSAVGSPDGAGALVGGGGEIVLQYNFPLTGEGIAATFLPIAAGVNVIAVSIGEVIAGVATFSGEFVLVDGGTGGVLGADLSALCSGVSGTGCSLLKLRNAGALMGSAGFVLDGVSGVTNAPEPSVWALMILGFAGIGWRIKKSRNRVLEGIERASATVIGPSHSMA